MSSKKTVVLASWNAPGHYIPLIGLADQLKSDGFRTIFVLVGPVAQAILDNGHELIMLNRRKRINPITGKEEIDIGAVDAVQQMRQDLELEPVECFIKTLKKLLDWGITENIIHYDDYMNEIERIKPDLVITDTACQLPGLKKFEYNPPWVMVNVSGPLVMYDRRKLPGGVRVPASIGTKLLENKEARDKLRREKPDEWSAMVDEWKQIEVQVDAARICRNELFDKFYMEHFGKYFDCIEHHYESPILNLTFFPREINYDQDDDLMVIRERWLKCDRPMPRSLRETNPEQAAMWESKLKEKMKGKRAMIYFSLGTLASSDVELIRKFVDVFNQDTERLYVVSLSDAEGKVELNPENMLGERFLPQTLILEHADLAIIHAGTNTVVECCYYGVPMLALPAFQDQYDNAQRVEDLNLGKRLNLYKCTGKELTLAIDELLSDESLRVKMKELGKRIQARYDIKKLSFVLQKLVNEKSLSQEFIDKCNAHEGLGFL